MKVYSKGLDGIVTTKCVFVSSFTNKIVFHLLRFSFAIKILLAVFGIHFFFFFVALEFQPVFEGGIYNSFLSLFDGVNDNNVLNSIIFLMFFKEEKFTASRFSSFCLYIFAVSIFTVSQLLQEKKFFVLLKKILFQ